MFWCMYKCGTRGGGGRLHKVERIGSPRVNSILISLCKRISPMAEISGHDLAMPDGKRRAFLQDGGIEWRQVVISYYLGILLPRISISRRFPSSEKDSACPVQSGNEIRTRTCSVHWRCSFPWFCRQDYRQGIHARNIRDTRKFCCLLRRTRLARSILFCLCLCVRVVFLFLVDRLYIPTIGCSMPYRRLTLWSDGGHVGGDKGGRGYFSCCRPVRNFWLWTCLRGWSCS